MNSSDGYANCQGFNGDGIAAAMCVATGFHVYTRYTLNLFLP